MFNRPQFRQVVLYAGSASTMFVLSWYLTPLVVWLAAILAGLGIVFISSALVYGFYWSWGEWHAARIREIEAVSNTERVMVLNALARLSDDQLHALMHANHLESVLTGIEPETVHVGGEDIPLLWFMEFTCSDDFLPAIGDYSEGSKERKWARALIAPRTGEWVRYGFVQPPAGNLRARWRNKAAALRPYEMELGVDYDAE